jgi:hypothetical protein
MDANGKAGHPNGAVFKEFDLSLPIEFRRVGGDVWFSGYTEKLGSAGVLFRSREWIEPQSQIEIVFRMPVSDPCNLICSGRVLRVDLPSTVGILPVISATIDRYSFVR